VKSAAAPGAVGEARRVGVSKFCYANSTDPAIDTSYDELPYRPGVLTLTP